MENSRSIRSCSHARTTESGFALAIALILAVLYFGLIELQMIDSSRELAAARRFRARVIAETLAENAAEGAALKIVDPTSAPVAFNRTDEQGEMAGTITKSGKIFTISGTGVSAGLESTRASVELRGTIEGTEIKIDYAKHGQ
jgi:hypothetical protein